MEEFLNVEWTVTPDADRVGHRYRGGELGFVEREQPAGAGSDPANVVDFGYPIGSIQVPGGVEPIASPWKVWRAIQAAGDGTNGEV